MPKFRTLTLQELQGLEKEFIYFLSINSITAEDWVKMKAKSPQDAEEFIDLFSDMIFENVLSKELYISFYDKQYLRAFHAQETILEEKGLFLATEHADFTNLAWCEDIFNNPPSDLQKYTRTIAYKNRIMDIFLLTEQGGLITDNQLFETLKSLN